MTIGLQKKVIPSGDTAQMQVTYNARDPGLFEKDVYVDFIGQDSTMRFTMKGHVKLGRLVLDYSLNSKTNDLFD